MTFWKSSSLVLTAIVAVVAACSDPDSSVPGVETSALAVQRPGLNEDETRRFLDGTSEFTEVDTAAEGLGPFFNGSSCAHCHSLGGIGGGGMVRVLRAVCRTADGATRDPADGSLVHLFSTRGDIATPTTPPDCEPVFTQRRSTALFGAGLIETIADNELEALAAGQPKAVRGRVGWVTPASGGGRRAGRFGWKAQHADLRSFAGDAYRNELGITNELFPSEVGDPAALALMDQTPDPEARVGAIDALADFMRFLAVPSSVEQPPSSFTSSGCADCHVPSVNGALGPVGAYSDFLLHDVGTGDGVSQGSASGNEFRTAPLWGLRHTRLYLHDGRASSVHEAIEQHGTQAASAAAAYKRLAPAEQARLIAFLSSL